MAEEQALVGDKTTENPGAAPAGGSAPNQTAEAAGTAQPGTEQKTGSEATQEARADGEKKTDDKPTGAPEKYGDFKVPEGFELDKAALEKFTPVAKELNLSQDQAQRLVTAHAELLKTALDSQMEGWQGLRKEWVESAQSDKEFGGTEFKANVAVAQKAVEAFGTKEFKEFLELTGAGDNPEFIRFAYRVGKAISEDKLHFGGAAQAAPKTLADKMFPNQGKQQ